MVFFVIMVLLITIALVFVPRKSDDPRLIGIVLVIAVPALFLMAAIFWRWAYLMNHPGAMP